MPTLHKNWDSSFALGGPIKRDKLWFYGNLRSFGIMSDVPGQYGNKNAGNPNAWSYVEDRSIQARNANDKKIAAIRLTGQLTPRNKLGFYEDYQKNCTGSSYSKDVQPVTRLARRARPSTRPSWELSTTWKPMEISETDGDF